MEISNALLIYAAVQLVNVIISTIKYVVTVKSRPDVAAIVNALSYTVSAVITYFIAKQDILPVIIITFVSNMIGVPIGRWIVDKCSKERLWVYHATVRCTEAEAMKIRKQLKDENLVHSTFEEISLNTLYSMRFFAYGKEDSRAIKSILESKDAKYYIIEPR